MDPELTLTAAQMRQLHELRQEHEHYMTVRLKEKPETGYIEVTLFDAEGEKIAQRVLFPA